MGVSYETYLSLNVIVWIKWSCLLGSLFCRENDQAPACSLPPPVAQAAVQGDGGDREQAGA